MLVFGTTASDIEVHWDPMLNGCLNKPDKTALSKGLIMTRGEPDQAN